MFAFKEEEPIAVLSPAVEFLHKAPSPIAVFEEPEVRHLNDNAPKAVLQPPEIVPLPHIDK